MTNVAQTNVMSIAWETHR